MKILGTLSGGIVIITLVTVIPAVLFLPNLILLEVFVLITLTGLGAGAAVFIGRKKATTGVMGGIASGFFLRIAGLSGAYWLVREDMPARVPVFAFALTAYFLHMIWTSCLFHISSSTGTDG